VRIAVQKSGRLAEKSLRLLEKCGLEFDSPRDQLLCQCVNFPVELMLVRDDDIPNYVWEGVCELGIVGHNVLRESTLERHREHEQTGNRGDVTNEPKIIETLGFGSCHLALAVPREDVESFDSISWLQGKRIATSYPATLGQHLRDVGVQAEVIHLSGSVEIAPSLGIADAVCDLVSTGATLRSNGLREVETILKSHSVLFKTGAPLVDEKRDIVARLTRRVNGVLQAANAKYIMMNAPRSAVGAICDLMPGMEEPTILELADHKATSAAPKGDDRVAIHAVASETDFWSRMEQLKKIGASSILVVPIEKILL